jgi:hypothetical protein
MKALAGISSGISDYMIGGIQADMQEAQQAHNNAMRTLSSAQQQNSMTLQEAQLQDKAARLGESLQIASMKDRGSAEVNAAAAGVAGGSVQMALLGLKRSAIQAQDARMRNLNSEMQAAQEQRNNIKLAGIMGEDISIIQRPSIGTALLGIGVSVMDTYDQNMPKGSKLADGKITDWFKRK